LKKLEHAQTGLDRGKPIVAYAMIGAFWIQVRLFVATGVLTPAEASRSCPTLNGCCKALESGS